MSFRRSRPAPTINIVPLVDVLVLLLFFFVLNLPDNPNLWPAKVLNITLPTMSTAGSNSLKAHLRLAVDAKGEIFCNGVAVSPGQLEAALRAWALEEAGVPVLITADQSTPLSVLVSLMDACRQAGLETLRLHTR
jgi:biopolymer transport protein ExbD